MSLGRNDLLFWINTALQTEYQTVEMLGDGVAYAQIIDAIHPGGISISRLNLTAKIPEENIRNMRIVQEAIRKLKINHSSSIQKIGQNKFQDNILFLQWIHAYASRHGAEALQEYPAYERRVALLQKQGRSPQEMSSHLKPNEAYWEGEEEVEGVDMNEEDEMLAKVEEMEMFVHSLEVDLSQKINDNWKMMLMIDRSIEERNSLYSLLQSIERIAMEAPKSIIKTNICNILQEVPAQFE